jgi:hypothetical protein
MDGHLGSLLTELSFSNKSVDLSLLVGIMRTVKAQMECLKSNKHMYIDIKTENVLYKWIGTETDKTLLQIHLGDLDSILQEDDHGGVVSTYVYNDDRDTWVEWALCMLGLNMLEKSVPEHVDIRNISLTMLRARLMGPLAGPVIVAQSIRYITDKIPIMKRLLEMTNDEDNDTVSPKCQHCMKQTTDDDGLDSWVTRQSCDLPNGQSIDLCVLTNSLLIRGKNNSVLTNVTVHDNTLHLVLT